MKKKLKVLLVFGEGGHTEQAIRLCDLMLSHDDEIIFDAFTSASSRAKFFFSTIKYFGEVPKDGSRLRKMKVIFYNLILTIFNLKFLLSAKKIIILGPGLTIPTMILCACLFRKKTVIFESWSRFATKSLTVQVALFLRLQVVYQNKQDDSQTSYGRLI